MNKFVLFNRTLWKSLFSFRYYHDVVKAPFSFSLKFFLAFSCLLGVIITTSVGIILYSPLQEFTRRFAERAYSLYPKDLVITLKNGELATNVSQAYHFPIPFELFLPQAPAISDEKQKYLVTIDTKASSGTYGDTQSIFLFTKDYLVMPKNAEDIQTIPLKEFEDVTINKTIIDEFIKKLLPFMHLLFPLIMLLVSLFVFILWPMGRIAGLLVFSLMLLPFVRLMGLTLTFKKVFQITLHSFLLPFFIETALFLFGLQPPISFFNLLLFILYNLIIFAELKSSPLTIDNRNS